MEPELRMPRWILCGFCSLFHTFFALVRKGFAVRAHPSPSLHRVFWGLTITALWFGPGVHANAQTGLLTLDTATLSSRSGTQLVNLPHKLAPQDFAAGGDRVRYRLVWALAELPQTPQAAYVGKLSLSGRLFVNGQLVGDCGNAPLERVW